SMGRKIMGYLEPQEKELNPYNLRYLGNEEELESWERKNLPEFFIAIGDNHIREKITIGNHPAINENLATIIHPLSYVSPTAQIGKGTMVAAQVAINAQAKIGKACICNTGSIIEHECQIGNFVHIAPGATLCGNVEVGNGSLIGANAVVKPGISIGEKAIIGAGAVIVKPVPDHAIIIGNPQHSL
ncbi:MAG: acetyltransferase, partial [Bacteroidota bacterium]